MVSDGVATFSGLTVDRAGTYELALSGPGLSDVVTAPVTVTPNLAVPTTTTLTISPAGRAAYGQPITLTAIVTPPAATGAVIFTLDGVAIQTTVLALTLVNGQEQATLTIPSPGTGTHSFQALYAGVAGLDLASQSSVTSFVVTPSVSDGPRVTNVWRTGYHWSPTTLTLAFNEALDPSSADNPNNYVIIGPGGHRIFVASAVYDVVDNRLTLHPSERLNLHWTYHLIVNGSAPYGLTDTQGDLLDGLANGRSGSNYVKAITKANWVRTLPAPVSTLSTVARLTKTLRLNTRLKTHPTGPVSLTKSFPSKAKIGTHAVPRRF